MKQKKTVRLTYEFEFEFDPESPEFRDTLESYQAVINSGGDEDAILESAAINILRRGIFTMIEGVGYVVSKSDISKHPHNSGIMVTEHDPFPEVEIQ